MMLWELQSTLASYHDEIWPDGGFSRDIELAVNFASGDFCKINHKSATQQAADSLLLGQTCKDELVALYKENGCSSALCNAVKWVQENGQEFVAKVVRAQNPEAFFNIIDEDLYSPIMEWSCDCAVPMMETWISCNVGIGEAKIWNLLTLAG